MKNKLLILITCLSLVGCSTTPKVVYVEKWTPPPVERLERPEIKAEKAMGDGAFVRQLQIDLINLTTYSKSLENQVEVLTEEK